MKNVRGRSRFAGIAGVLGVTVVASGLLAGPADAAASGPAGAVFSLSNAASGNSVLSWVRTSKGELTPGPSYATGGLGSGAGLGSQGSVTLSSDKAYLLAVDAGSNELSAFSVEGTSLQLLNTIGSRGDQPISVTVSDGVVYALNAGSSPNVSGYRLGSGGLTPIQGAVRELPAGAAQPAEVAFTPAGDHLVVTEKATNRIDTFAVDASGVAGPGVTSPSAGATPFGFDFNNKGTLLVSDAAGGAPGASTGSSYRVNADGSVSVISGAIPTTKTAACWLVATNNGKVAFVSDTGSGTISAFAVGNDGSLTLLDGAAATPGGATSDAAFDAASQHLFTLDVANDKIDGFAVGHDGSLTTGSTVTGLPAAGVGLAAF
ncbi:MAG TPA: hypothetical protein VMT27_03905 [Actinomycetes bacterium]|nr:hypothetical protein [Actinomycetes bacterium]